MTIGLNNIYNIRYNKRNRWVGQCGETRGFCNFQSKEHAIRAAAIILCYSYRSIGVHTIDQIVRRFAPPSENNCDAYINYVSDKTGLAKNKWLCRRTEYASILSAMAYFETNVYVSTKEIFDLMVKHKIYLRRMQ